MLNTKIMENITYAFFDVDDTIISIKSMFNFMDLYFKAHPSPSLENEFNQKMSKLLAADTKWEIVNAKYYEYFRNFSFNKINIVCQLWFQQNATDKTTFYHQNILKELKQHQSQGTVCVFVSGSFRELLQPIADDLGVEHILSINLERDGDRYTGRFIPPQTIGNGKADAIRLFLEANGGNAEECYAYGDDISDVPMLEAVGNPRAVAGGRRLEAYAIEKGWPIIQPN